MFLVANRFTQAATPTGQNTGDVWYETDTGRWWYWNGTSWASQEIFQYVYGTDTAIAATANLYAPIHQTTTIYDILVLDLFQSLRVDATNDSTNYWRLRLIQTVDAVTRNLIGTELTTQGLTANQFNIQTQVQNQTVSSITTPHTLSMDIVKQASPGGINGYMGFTYRLLHP